jgi:hypothetical protein
MFKQILFLITIGLVAVSCHNPSPEEVAAQKALVAQKTFVEDSAKWIITAPPDSLKLDKFYKQYVLVNGIPVVCSNKVPKAAIYKACNIVQYMTSLLSKEVMASMVKYKARVGIMAKYEGTTDIPEHAFLKEDTTINWDMRARGLGGDTIAPLTTCAEENLLCYVSDKYHAEDILIHEFAHAIHLIGILPVDTNINSRLQKALDDAKKAGKWQKTYAGTNFEEYWAEGVQSWFNVNTDVPVADGTHSPINLRKELKEYDPQLYAIIEKYFPEVTDEISCHSVPFE